MEGVEVVQRLWPNQHAWKRKQEFGVNALHNLSENQDGSKKARIINFMLVIVTTYGALTLNNQSRAPPLRTLPHDAFREKVMPAGFSCPVHASG